LITSAASILAPLEIKDEWIKKGALVLLNSPSRGDDAFWLNSRVVLDHPGLHQTYMEEAQAAGSPEEILKAYFATIGGNLYRLVDEGALPPLDQFTTLGQIINGKALADAEGRTTVFISGGMGIFDVAWGTQIYRNACAAGIGTSLNLWESPAEL
ncbi:MAG: ornithine cyclodeaminase, partial [Firmicutes bacterium]|nr:ornithine cyclodeaminase [Bacillota bacterium]